MRIMDARGNKFVVFDTDEEARVALEIIKEQPGHNTRFAQEPTPEQVVQRVTERMAAEKTC